MTYRVDAAENKVFLLHKGEEIELNLVSLLHVAELVKNFPPKKVQEFMGCPPTDWKPKKDE